MISFLTDSLTPLHCFFFGFINALFKQELKVLGSSDTSPKADMEISCHLSASDEEKKDQTNKQRPPWSVNTRQCCVCFPSARPW